MFKDGDDDINEPEEGAEPEEEDGDLYLSTFDLKQASRRKKAPVDDTAKKFHAFVKLYFSSLTARRSPFVFFNLDETGDLLLSNSDGVMFTVFNSNELGIHHVHFKQHKEQLAMLQETLLMDQSNTIYVANIATYLAQVNKFKKVGIDVWTSGNSIICTEKDVTIFDKKQVTARLLGNFHVGLSAKHWLNYLRDVDITENNPDPHFIIDLDPDPKLIGIANAVPLPIMKFKRHDGTVVFKDYHDHFTPVIFDGVSTPATKEFIKKQTTGTYTYRLFAWVEHDRYIRLMTIYEDDNIVMRSMKPHIAYYPVPKR